MAEFDNAGLVMCLHLEHTDAIVELPCDWGEKVSEEMGGWDKNVLSWSWFAATVEGSE
jgi:hypothetical protein